MVSYLLLLLGIYLIHLSLKFSRRSFSRCSYDEHSNLFWGAIHRDLHSAHGCQPQVMPYVLRSTEPRRPSVGARGPSRVPRLVELATAAVMPRWNENSRLREHAFVPSWRWKVKKRPQNLHQGCRFECPIGVGAPAGGNRGQKHQTIRQSARRGLI